MSIFRPSNINKRLVGTINTATGGSPGNAGQIGPTKTPYCIKGLCQQLCLGQRCCGTGANGGIFRINESFCGTTQNCNIPFTDCKGFFICCQVSPTAKWFVAPSCTQVSRSWYGTSDAVSLANSCMGSCGWFVPSMTQLINPGAKCISFWDSFSGGYWSSTQGSTATTGCGFGQPYGVSVPYVGGNSIGTKTTICPVRAFRCVSY